MLGLLVGLLILSVVGFIPYLGGLVHFGMVALVWEHSPGSFYRGFTTGNQRPENGW